MTRIGYARVSSDDQHAEKQVPRLEAAGCEKVFADQAVSGALASRPEWDKCLAYLREGDVLVATKLDRFGRSVLNICKLVGELAERGIGLVCLDQQIDTTSPYGKFQLHVLAAFAELERDMIRERTREGLAATPKRGRAGGRTPKLDAYDVGKARELISSGKSVAEVAATLKVGRATLYRALARGRAA